MTISTINTIPESDIGNNIMNKPFSLEDGLKIQEQDLIRWKQLLRPEVCVKVLEAVERQNAELKHKWANAGYEVCRGVDIANIVLNIGRE